jgi:hypothetical protein
MSVDRKRPHIRLLGTIDPGKELALVTPAMLRPVKVYELELVHGGDIWLASVRVGDSEDAEQLVSDPVPLRALVGMHIVFDMADVGITMRLRLVSHERAPRNVDLRLYYLELQGGRR